MVYTNRPHQRIAVGARLFTLFLMASTESATIAALKAELKAKDEEIAELKGIKRQRTSNVVSKRPLVCTIHEIARTP